MSKVWKGEPRSAPDATLPAILEFQWPSTAIVNAPIPRSARSIVWLVTSMVFVLVATLGLIAIDQVVTARGIVVSKSPTILVQPLETAIVRSIDVREGQEVRAGQLLGTARSDFCGGGSCHADRASIEPRGPSRAPAGGGRRQALHLYRR